MAKQPWNKRWNQDQLIEAVAKSFSVCGTLRSLGLSLSAGNRTTVKRWIEKLKLDTTHFGTDDSLVRGLKWLRAVGALSADEVFQLNSECQPARVRSEYKKISEYRCQNCDLTDNWQNKTLTLQLEHINGNNKDHRLKNLCWLCPNCHSQTNTWGNRNAEKWKDGKRIRRRRGEANKVPRPEKRRIEYTEVLDSVLFDGNCSRVSREFGISDVMVRKIVNKYGKEEHKECLIKRRRIL